jgi:beta-glucanase (GH16 family)
MNFYFFLTALFILQFTILPKDYKGAEYRTKMAFTYGRFEVRMKAANREGMLTSFFTYFDGTSTDPWSSSKWNEIDLEIMGRYNDNVQFNTITTGQVNHVSHYPTTFSPHIDYHTYAFEWTPQYVAWFVDGIEVLRQTASHIATLTRPQKIMMNIWNPLYENWAGTLNPVSLPVFAYYDWVSYYAYTPGAGSYGTNNNFTLNWTDNFDNWDTSRWEKATHTWDGNGCDFIQENAVFKDGKLILCLTNSTDIGFTDVTQPSILWARASTDKVTVMFSEEVDKDVAENISNYFIPGITINSAVRNEDLMSVDLHVTGLVIPISKSIAVITMKDLFGNIMPTKGMSIIMPQLNTFPIKINCAGTPAINYLPEVNWSPNTDYGSMDGSNTIYAASLQISGTDEDVIYQSERYGTVGYKIRVPNGNYDVKLMFAENYFTSSNSRVFDVYIEHQRVIENLDIFNQIGINTALEKDFLNVSVNDGVLDIQFAEKIDNSLINGIVITVNTTDIKDKYHNDLDGFNIEQNYPNPFNGKTVINYSLHKTDNLIFLLYNILGEQIFFEDLGSVAAGFHQYFLDTSTLVGNSPLASGVYFYVFSTFSQRETRKLVLLN